MQVCAARTTTCTQVAPAPLPQFRRSCSAMRTPASSPRSVQKSPTSRSATAWPSIRTSTAASPELCDHLSAVGVTRDGGLAEQFTAPATVVYKLPDNVSLRDAAAIEPVSCAVHGLDLLKLHPYQKALVIGDGFMGQIFVQLLQAYGVHQVDLAGIFDEKLQRNKELFGVTETYNTTREQIPADSYDVIVEAVGLPATQAQAVAAAKKGAQVLMFGVGPQEAHFEMNTYDIYKKQLTIQGSFINPLTFRDAISLVSAGKMNIGGLISHELGLDEVQDFLDGKIKGVSKAVVKIGE